MFYKTVLAGAFLAAQALANDGAATYYDQNGAAGSCGQYNSDSAYIVSLSNYWQQGQSPGPYCGRRVQIRNTGGGLNNFGVGRVIEATVADTCVGCDANHLDLSRGAFLDLTGGQLDPPGTFNINWNFL